VTDGASYVDSKGRTRWHENDLLAARLKDLHDLLVIGGYPPDHAARYPKLAYTLSRHPEPVGQLLREGRLAAVSGVGKIVVGILVELIETGDCAKMREPSEGYFPPPRSVLELTAIPGLGAKTARALYAERGITGRCALQRAVADGAIDGFPGLGPKLRAAIEGAV
jgi:DNA polymerase (family 10)